MNIYQIILGILVFIVIRFIVKKIQRFIDKFD